jgi:hypothetical protein
MTQPNKPQPKDPEQMTKHELVQTIYKLAEANQKLVSVEDLYKVIHAWCHVFHSKDSCMTLAIDIHALMKGEKDNDTTKEA